MALHLVEHPLAGKILTDLRDETTQTSQFRELGKRLAYLLLMEATRGLQTKQKKVKTPLASFNGTDLGQSIVVVPILRAGLAMLQPAVEMLQNVSIGYIGMERDAAATARTYYCKLPNLKGKFVILLDPIIATGQSAEQALEMIAKQEPDGVVMVSMVVSPDGIRRLENSFPRIPIYAVAMDERLDEHKFVVPGLGDFGDRAYGTK
ncbi:MAG: uracil phosphoribosyltransferase [Puniceicoccales bacterium]|jgi:uracil phosphoribosyltransferase|nr:uracil phosphoribosyltransferase [Puniceicoccales bacterium]